jgi:rare lipoprotein A
VETPVIAGAFFVALLLVTILPSHNKEVASFMSYELEGRVMANGHRFHVGGLTAASWDLPFGARVRVTNLLNGRSVVVTITDRGPAFWTRRTIDLSLEAASRIGMLRDGVVPVRIQRLPELPND